MNAKATTAVIAAKPKGLFECLCEEHKALAGQLGLLDSVADSIGKAPLETLRHDLDRVYVVLAQGVLPHEKMECEFRRRLATRDCAGWAAGYDQAEVEALVRRLGSLKSRAAKGGGDETWAAIRHVLYELHALTRIHFGDELPERFDAPER